MLKTFLKAAWRNLRREKVHSFINITGLAMGMAVVGLIGLWIWDECTCDRYNPDYDHIARLMQNETVNGVVSTTPSIPYPLLNVLRTTYGSAFKRVGAAWWVREHVLSYGNRKITQNGNFMEPEAADMVALHLVRESPVLRGHEGAALRDPAAILLSAGTAQALFGNDDPIGRVLHIDNKMTVAVKGIYADLPANSAFKDLQFIAPFSLFVAANDWIKDLRTDWGYDLIQVYIEMADHVDVNILSERLRNSTLIHMRGDPLAAAYRPQVFVQPMSRWHLYAFKNGVSAGGPIEYVWLFGTIGVLVLLLACINFMNLSTARSERRAKEVGIRKAIGSLRVQIVLQFYSESMLTAFLAFALSLLLVIIALPWFNVLAGKNISIQWASPGLWVAGLGFSCLTGLLAGSYPALYLSSFRPIAVLKVSRRAGIWASTPRRVLVALQFCVSILLVMGTLVVFRQIRFTHSRPVGYEREGLVSLNIDVPEFGQRARTLRQELLQTGVVVETGVSSSPANRIWESFAGFDWPGKDPSTQAEFATISVSQEYGATIGWKIAAGRDFSRAYATDSAGLIVNEAAVAFMGLHTPIGTMVRWDEGRYRIIGVVKDMIVEAPYERARPTVYLLNYDFNHYWYFIRLRPGLPIVSALASIRTAFLHVLPDADFDFHFVDEQYDQLFAGERRLGTLAAAFAFFALFISALGIFGMAAFMAEQRRKEIAVRRVLGATVLGIWQLLSREFLLLVGLSAAVAGPIGWLAMQRWLAGYTLHTNITWWIFAASDGSALVITMLTAGWTTATAALANPADGLRT
jgi:hypothetical protein